MKILITLLGIIFLIACASHHTAQMSSDDPHYAWYRDIQKKVQTAWADKFKSEVKGLHEKGYAIAKSSEPSRVRLLVKVNSAGDVQDISLLESSHIEILDRTAMDAFRSTSPLPAPPKELIKNGVAEVRWDFVLDR